MSKPRGANLFQLESGAQLTGVLAGLIGALVAAIIFWSRTPAIWGAWSIGLVGGIVVGLTSLAAAYLNYWRARYRPGQEWRLDLPSWKFIVDATAVALVHAILATLLTFAVFVLLQLSLKGARLDIWWAMVLIGLSAGLASYWVSLSVTDMTTAKMSTLLVQFMVVAILGAMATAPQEDWWTYHFSALGTSQSPSSWLFNFSLISAGLLLVGFALYLDRDLQALADLGELRNQRTPRFMSVGFIIAGFSLAGIGAVPVSWSILIHNTFASGTLLVLLGMMLLAGWLLRGLPWQFMATTYGFVLALVVTVLLWQPVQYFGLTAMELVSFALVFAWVSLLIRMLNVRIQTIAETQE